VTALNLLLSFNLGADVKINNKETIQRIEASESLYLETVTKETSEARKLIKSSEYVITDKDKNDVMSLLLSSISQYESIMRDYERAYILAEKNLLNVKSETEALTFKKSIERIIQNKQEYLSNNVDIYYINHHTLKTIFNVDIKKEN